MNLRKLITRIQCIRFRIKYKHGMYIHPLCSIQKSSCGIIEIEEEAYLQNMTFVKTEKTGYVKICKGTFLNAGTRIDCINSIQIGEKVMTGPFVYISDFNHRYNNINLPIQDQGLSNKGGICIGKGTWIGAHSTIVDSVNIGKGCVIGANSVVTRDIPDYCVAVGSPAKIIKQYDFNLKEWIRI